jgi:hypothetical protein
MRKVFAAAAALILSLLLVTACGTATKSAPEHRTKKLQHSEVYHDASSGRTYTQAYNDDGMLIWYILWMNQINSPYISSSPVTSLPSASSWTRADTGGSVGGASSYAPNTGALASTNRVATVNEDGEPEVEEGELTPDTEVPADEVTNLDTSPEEAQADAAFDNQVDTDNANVDNGVDVEGDSGNVGGDSGDMGGNSGGDSGGGGDFSGGDSGGGFDSGGGGDFGG